MWETADLQPARTGLALPEAVRQQFQAFRDQVTHRSAVVWGEHCTECAFPSCYSSCAFYTPREDLHCRRFENGIERATDPTARDLNLARIVFRRWGKLEGHGPLGMKPARSARRFEGLDAGLTPALRLAPRRLADKAVWRLNSAKHGLAGRGEPIAAQDQFVVEAWHDGAEPVPFTLTFLPSGEASDRLFQTAISLAPGYNRVSIRGADIAARVDLSQPYLVQLEPVVESPPPIVFGLLDFVRVEAAAAAQPAAPTAAGATVRPKVKCVVWDLDNTVWRGTLAEDGVEGLTPFPEAVEAIKALDARGILNSIASKNDREPALEALARFGLLDYFVFPQISWNPKSDAIRAIAKAIDIGADTFVFIDDQPFERGEVETFLPEVEVLPDSAIPGLLQRPRLDVPVTAESAQRRLMYKTEEQRQAAFDETASDYNEFLRGCDIRLTVAPLSAPTILRVFELSQRTNQLNVSGRRYTREELEAMVANGAGERTYVLSCADRFGDYGIIGFCVLDPQTRAVESFFMSCRVQRKRVENAFFGLLSAELAEARVDLVRIGYCKTAKNGAAVRMLSELGFEYEAQDDEHGVFLRRSDAPVADADIVTVARQRAAARQAEAAAA
jgi:FkbH-like protein